MLDLLPAMRTLAIADAGIAALVSGRVFVDRIPRDVIEAQDPHHPAKILVLRHAGGQGSFDLSPLRTMFVTTLSYGETGYEARRVMRAASDWMDSLLRICVADILIHHVNPTGGPLPLVDPEITWPGVAQTYTVLAAVLEEVA